MKSIRKVSGIFMAAAAILALSSTAGFARVAPQSAFQAADLIVLTENHARTIAFDLDALAGGSGGLHSIYLLSLILGDAAAGNLFISLAYNSPLTKGDEVIYFVTGLVGTMPVFQYVYSTGGTFGASIKVPKVAFGALFVGVLYASGVDFPVTLRATASLTL